MSEKIQIKNSTICLHRGDITDVEIEAFVYYARPDLLLGSGFGTAISMRGGLSIQNELKEHGTKSVTDVVITQAGKMKAEKIVHAVGPAFQEPDLEDKLKKTIINVLNAVDKDGIKQIAFPPMGAGFYGVPLDVSATVTLDAIAEYLNGDTGIKEVSIYLLDNRDYQPYQKKLTQVSQS